MSLVSLSKRRTPHPKSIANAQAAVARASALTRVAARTANPPKEYAPKTRGKKASAGAKSAEKKDEDVIELD